MLSQTLSLSLPKKGSLKEYESEKKRKKSLFLFPLQDKAEDQ